MLLLITSFSKLLSSENENKNSIMTYLKLEKQIMLPKEITDYKDLIIKYINNEVYIYKMYMGELSPKDSLPIYRINDNGIFKLIVKVPRSQWINNFDICNNKLYLLGQYYLNIYMINDTALTLINEIKIPSTYLDIRVCNDKIILNSICWSCTNKGIKTLIYDTSGNYIDYHEFNRPHGFRLEFWSPSKRLDYYHNKYLVSNILDYNITIFNDKFDTIGKLSRVIPILENNKNDTSFNDEITYKEWIKTQNITNDKSSSASRIELAEFIDDTTILVCYSDTRKSQIDQHIHDIWRLNSSKNTWELYKADLTDRINKSDDDTIKMEFVANTILNNYSTSNGKIFMLQYIPFELGKYDITKMTYNEFYKLTSAFYEKSEPIKSLFMYSIK